MVPLYVIVDTLGLVDSLLGIILVSISFPLPVAVLTGFMRSLPKDSSTRPLSTAPPVGHLPSSPHPRPPSPRWRPFFVITWNDLLFPLLFLKTDVNKTLPLALEFRGQYLTDYPLSSPASSSQPSRCSWPTSSSSAISFDAGSVKG